MGHLMSWEIGLSRNHEKWTVKSHTGRQKSLEPSVREIGRYIGRTLIRVFDFKWMVL